MLNRILAASLIASPALAQMKAGQAPLQPPVVSTPARQPAPPPPPPEPAPLAMTPTKLTFADAIKRAVERNPTALQALAEIGRAQGIFEEVRAAALPTLFATGALTRLDSDRISVTPAAIPGGTPTTTLLASKNQQSANATLTIPLLAPKAWLQAAQAHEQVDIARFSLEDARRVVAVATARAYLAVMAQHRLVEIDQQARVDAKAHLDDAHARFEVGSGNRLDEVRAAQELETDESQLAAALSNVVRSTEALGVLVGADGPIEVTDDLQLPNPPAPADALQDAESIRADIKAGKIRTEAARKVVRDDYADYLPLLTAVVEPFYQHPALTTVPETGWQAELVLTIPLYDGGARYGQHKERKALYEESQIALDNLLRQARSDVRTAFDAVKRADEGLRSARNAAKLGHEALEMTNLAYREGATNDLEVVDAEQRSRNADTAALVAEDAARQARIDLLSASGKFP
ncbi:MAG TPA: TolC family protein [Myxococcales bacterium]|nr:TolC family protein [Myxococcales bacterium]